MKNNIKQKLQMFQGLSYESLVEVNSFTIAEVYQKIKDPTGVLKTYTDVTRLTKQNDIVTYEQQKISFPKMSFACTFNGNGRSLKSVDNVTGFIVVDIDKIENPDKIEDLKLFIIDNFQPTLMHTTISNSALRLIYNCYDSLNKGKTDKTYDKISRYSELQKEICNRLEVLIGMFGELGDYVNDITPIVKLMTINYDENAYYNPDATFTSVLPSQVGKKNTKKVNARNSVELPDKKYELYDKVIGYCGKNKGSISNHDIRRNMARLAGGYIYQYVLDEQEVENKIIEIFDSYAEHKEVWKKDDMLTIKDYLAIGKSEGLADHEIVNNVQDLKISGNNQHVIEYITKLFENDEVPDNFKFEENSPHKLREYLKHPKLCGMVFFNDVSSGINYINDSPINEQTETNMGYVVHLITTNLEKYYGKVKSRDRDIRDTLDDIFRVNEFNVYKAYVDSLVWDKVDRVETLISTIFNIDYDRLKRTASSKVIMRSNSIILMHALISRPYNPGCKQDYSFVITGSQGLSKTSILKELYLRDDRLVKPASIYKEDYLNNNIRGMKTQNTNLLILDEFELYDRDISRFKSISTDNVDNFKFPYGKTNIVRKKYYSNVMATNKSKPLNDLNNRRFIVIPLSSFLSDNDSGAVQYLRDNFNQLVAEYIYKSKTRKNYPSLDDINNPEVRFKNFKIFKQSEIENTIPNSHYVDFSLGIVKLGIKYILNNNGLIDIRELQSSLNDDSNSVKDVLMFDDSYTVKNADSAQMQADQVKSLVLVKIHDLCTKYNLKLPSVESDTPDGFYFDFKQAKREYEGWKGDYARNKINSRFEF